MAMTMTSPVTQETKKNDRQMEKRFSIQIRWSDRSEVTYVCTYVPEVAPIQRALRYHPSIAVKNREVACEKRQRKT